MKEKTLKEKLKESKDQLNDMVDQVKDFDFSKDDNLILIIDLKASELKTFFHGSEELLNKMLITIGKNRNDFFKAILTTSLNLIHSTKQHDNFIKRLNEINPDKKKKSIIKLLK